MGVRSRPNGFGAHLYKDPGADPEGVVWGGGAHARRGYRIS